MANIRLFNPWGMVPSVWEDANDLMERTFGAAPKVNVYEKDDVVHVEAELAGYTAEDVDISVTGDVLKLTANKKEQIENKDTKDGRRYFISEISEKSFTRTLTLPYEVVTDNVQASFKDGVLRIALPKSEKALPKTIKIEAK